MVNVKNASRMVDELALMKMFPARDENARVGLVRLVCEMATTDDQVRWLVTRMLNVYAEWPGAREMRACFCGKFRPADGINAYSTVYPDGIPSDASTRPRIAQAEPKLLASADGKGIGGNATGAAVRIASGLMATKSVAMQGPATKAEIAAAPEWLREIEGYSE